jgi:NADH-quinone oxidoreductase subunit I
MIKYTLQIFQGSISLLKGMAITFKYMFKRPITVQYPDEKREMPLRYRGRLVLPVDPEKGDHRCTGCMACVRACPNRSLEVERITDETGKPRPKAARFRYNLGTCMFCNLCVEACTFAAIIMSDEYECSTEDKAKLQLELVGEKYQLTGKKAPWWQSKFKVEL